MIILRKLKNGNGFVVKILMEGGYSKYFTRLKEARAFKESLLKRR